MRTKRHLIKFRHSAEKKNYKTLIENERFTQQAFFENLIEMGDMQPDAFKRVVGLVKRYHTQKVKNYANGNPDSESETLGHTSLEEQQN